MKIGIWQKMILILAAGVAIALATAPAYADYVTSLQAYYKFDEISGTTAYDARGGYDASNVNATVNVSGKFDRAYYFNNSNSRVVTPLISAPGDYTWSAWIKPASLPTSYNDIDQVMGLLGGYYNWNSDNTAIGIGKGDQLGLFVYNNEGAPNYYVVYHFSSYPTLNEWYLVTATVSTTGGTTLYWNGSVIGSDSGLTAPIGVAAPLMIGANANGPQRYFHGAIDEVAIWSRALTTEEVGTLYSSGQSLSELMSNRNPLDEGGGGGVPEPATVTGLISVIFMLVSRRVYKRIRL